MRHSHQVSGYGVFCGGDPRMFEPDADNTADQLQRHKEDCAAWDGGDFCSRGGYGLGGYTMEFECDDPKCPDNEPELPHPQSYRPDLPLSPSED